MKKDEKEKMEEEEEKKKEFLKYLYELYVAQGLSPCHARNSFYSITSLYAEHRTLTQSSLGTHRGPSPEL